MISGIDEMTVGNEPDNCGDGSVSLGVVAGMLSYAVGRGANPEDLLRDAGLSQDQLSDRDERISLQRYLNFFRSAQRQLRDPALAIKFAASADFSEVSVAGLIANASETMLHALHQLNRFGRLAIDAPHTGSVRIAFEENDAKTWLVDRRIPPDKDIELTEASFTYLITGPRRFLPRPHILEASVVWPEPDYADVYREIWQCPIQFNAERNALRMDSDLVHHRVRLQPEYAFGILTQHAEKLLADLGACDTFRSRVERALMPVLHTGTASIERIAQDFGLSRQSIYRQLKEEGTTFEQVHDELRRNLALDYLTTKRVSIAEAAYLTGFSEPSSFSRAFKRWTNKAPSSYVQEME